MKILVIALVFTSLGSAQQPFLGINEFSVRRNRTNSDLLGITPYVSAGLGYQTGLGGATLGPDSKLESGASGSITASFGVSGVHSWKKDSVAIAWNTGYYNTFKFDQANGIAEALKLGWVHEFTPKTTMSISTSLSSGTAAFGMPGMVGLGGMSYFAGDFRDPNADYAMTNELLDVRNFGVAMSGDLNHNLNRDWAVSIGGTGYTMMRSGSTLIDSYGTSARAQVSRRLGRKSSFGVGYSFALYTYTKGIGDMTSHTATLSYARQLGRVGSLSLSGGVVRTERIGVQRFTVDPLIQQILGITSATAIVYGINYFGAGSASLTRSYRRHSASLSGSMGTSPGNGVYAGSRSITGSLGYSYSGFGRWGVSSYAGYSHFSSLMIDTKPYQDAHMSVGLSRALFAGVSASLSGGLRRSLTGNNMVHRTYSFASFSVGYAPGEFRLPGWW